MSRVAVIHQAGRTHLSLPIESSRVEPDGTAELVLRGSFDGRSVAATLRLRGGMSPRPDDQRVYLNGAVFFASYGKESERLLAAIAQVWEQPTPGRMRTAAAFATLPVSGLLPDSAVELKAFCGKKDDVLEGWGELCLAIDLGAKTVELREQDPAYRVALLKAFSVDANPDTR